MKKPFVHDAELHLDARADIHAPGAAITTALCGSWQHEGPCPLAPHHTYAVRRASDLAVRVVFATEPESESLVRSIIVDALAGGELVGPDGQLSSWRLLRNSAGVLAVEDGPLAARLAQGG